MREARAWFWLNMRGDCACSAKGMHPLMDVDGFGAFVLSEAALRASGTAERLVTDDVTLADIILFNSLSHSYGNQSFRDKHCDLFRACFPRTANFYHKMLTDYPHLRQYMFSDVHTPAVYFMPWQLQQPHAYTYATADSSDSTTSGEMFPARPLSKDAQDICSKFLDQVKERESIFPLVRDDHVKPSFSSVYLHEAFAEENKVKDDLRWELLVRVCKHMGVTKIADHSGASAPSDGPVLSWNREDAEMFIPAVYVAARKGAFPLESASEGAKILQVVSTVRQLANTWAKDVDAFKTESCDKSKAGGMFTNVSPGNVAFLECLLSLNCWKEGRPIVSDRETLADIYVRCFMELLDERILQHGEGFLSWGSWHTDFPLLCSFYKAQK